MFCSGGIFEALWNGIVEVNKTILVVDRTVLNISGVGTDNAIDGGDTIPLFVTLNVFLYVSDSDILNGNATSGRAIAASRSSSTFTRTAISDNTASNHGGEMLVSDASSVAFTGKTVFSSYTAVWGGAMVVTSGSNISWEGMTISRKTTPTTTVVPSTSGRALWLGWEVIRPFRIIPLARRVVRSTYKKARRYCRSEVEARRHARN